MGRLRERKDGASTVDCALSDSPSLFSVLYVFGDVAILLTPFIF